MSEMHLQEMVDHAMSRLSGVQQLLYQGEKGLLFAPADGIRATRVLSEHFALAVGVYDKRCQRKWMEEDLTWALQSVKRSAYV